ncbi:hypothetical protein [Bradyrhizobium erythrophlei]|uniref:hypothetical protein n=1 Tax=Bradyrhizobium erythrophlei TaxID=1437360 RepID=UPI001FCD4C56|nr:hypothetical protein [Bradyrhizobium erythrophlei]
MQPRLLRTLNLQPRSNFAYFQRAILNGLHKAFDTALTVINFGYDLDLVSPGIRRQRPPFGDIGFNELAHKLGVIDLCLQSAKNQPLDFVDVVFCAVFTRTAFPVSTATDSRSATIRTGQSHAGPAHAAP